MDWNRESEMFNQAADYYDQYRSSSSYPREIIDTLIHQTGVIPDDQLLEIGAGSGKATELLSSRGFQIQCIEPGPDLVKMGQKKFKDYPRIKYHITRFEDYKIDEKAFDLIFSAQALHWVPQPIGLPVYPPVYLKYSPLSLPLWLKHLQ